MLSWLWETRKYGVGMISNGTVLISYFVKTVNWLESWEGGNKDIDR
jgi:hypothetical protein